MVGEVCLYVKGDKVPCDRECTVPGLFDTCRELARDGVNIDFKAVERIGMTRCPRLRNKPTPPEKEFPKK